MLQTVRNLARTLSIKWCKICFLPNPNNPISSINSSQTNSRTSTRKWKTVSRSLAKWTPSGGMSKSKCSSSTCRKDRQWNRLLSRVKWSTRWWCNSNNNKWKISSYKRKQNSGDRNTNFKKPSRMPSRSQLTKKQNRTSLKTQPKIWLASWGMTQIQNFKTASSWLSCRISMMVK